MTLRQMNPNPRSHFKSFYTRQPFRMLTWVATCVWFVTPHCAKNCHSTRRLINDCDSPGNLENMLSDRPPAVFMDMGETNIWSQNAFKDAALLSSPRHMFQLCWFSNFRLIELNLPLRLSLSLFPFRPASVQTIHKFLQGGRRKRNTGLLLNLK